MRGRYSAGKLAAAVTAVAMGTALMACEAKTTENRGTQAEAPAIEEHGNTDGLAKLSLDVSVAHDDASGEAAGKRSTTTERSVRATFRGESNENAPRLPVGELLEVCFTATEAGWVTVWDYDADGKETRIYPNAFAPAKLGNTGIQVAANERACIGRKGDPFQLRLRPPLGPSNIYLHWTKDDKDQLSADMFRSVGRSIRSGGTRDVSTEPFLSATFSYDLVSP